MTSHLDMHPAKHPAIRARRSGISQRTGDTKSLGVPKQRGRNRKHKVIGGLAAFALLSACSSGSESTASDNAAVPTIILTTTTTERATTVPVTEPTPSTTEDPRPAIEAAFEGYTQYLPTHGLTINEDALEAAMAGWFLNGYIERLDEYLAAGLVLGEVLHKTHIVTIEIDDGDATVTSCDLDAISLLTASGGEYIPADINRFGRTTLLELLPQGWRVIDAGFSNGIQAICEI